MKKQKRMNPEGICRGCVQAAWTVTSFSMSCSAQHSLVRSHSKTGIEPDRIAAVHVACEFTPRAEWISAVLWESGYPTRAAAPPPSNPSSRVR